MCSIALIVVCYDTRAAASLKRLAELNPYVTVDTLTQSLDQLDSLDFLHQYQVRSGHDGDGTCALVTIAVCSVVWS